MIFGSSCSFYAKNLSEKKLSRELNPVMSRGKKLVVFVGGRVRARNASSSRIGTIRSMFSPLSCPISMMRFKPLNENLSNKWSMIFPACPERVLIIICYHFRAISISWFWRQNERICAIKEAVMWGWIYRSLLEIAITFWVSCDAVDSEFEWKRFLDRASITFPKNSLYTVVKLKRNTSYPTLLH